MDERYKKARNTAIRARTFESMKIYLDSTPQKAKSLFSFKNNNKRRCK
jgi:hypothetical protein